MTTGWFESAGTFKKCTAEKVSFVALGAFDLALTLVSHQLGFEEMNPFVGFLIHLPLLLLAVKLFVPVVIAWFMPGKLLLPSVALLGMVVLWDVLQLVLFLA